MPSPDPSAAAVDPRPDSPAAAAAAAADPLAGLPIDHPVRAALATSLRGTVDLLPAHEWAAKLRASHETGRPLRIKLGLDPTAPDLHVGHTVVLNKLRELQRLGHTVIFLIGDFTASIGDPSGRNATRPPLTREQIDANAQTYRTQAGRVLDLERTEIRHNSEWGDELGARGMIRLAAQSTVARMLERDDFAKRYAARTPISIHEFLYPLMQGWDSVALRSDLECGGTDQKFNLLMGRQLQHEQGQSPQCILTMPLLEGLDGVDKMSKSKGNVIGVTEPAEAIYAKTMSIDDTLMWRWFDLLSWREPAELARLRAEVAAGRNPRDAKDLLARELAARFHDVASAERAAEDFARRARGGAPDDVAELTLAVDAPIALPALLRRAGLAPSATEAQRLVAQRGVRVDGGIVEDRALAFAPGTVALLQVGKRKFVRVTLVAAQADRS